MLTGVAGTPDGTVWRRPYHGHLSWRAHGGDAA